jgi:hypothetical protein
MRQFISTCAAILTVLGAFGLAIGILLFLAGLGSDNYAVRETGSFSAIFLTGSGLTSVLLGGTTFMLCSIDQRLEAKFGALPKSAAYSEAAYSEAGITHSAEHTNQSAPALPEEGETAVAGIYRLSDGNLYRHDGGPVRLP